MKFFPGPDHSSYGWHHKDVNKKLSSLLLYCLLPRWVQIGLLLCIWRGWLALVVPTDRPWSAGTFLPSSFCMSHYRLRPSVPPLFSHLEEHSCSFLIVLFVSFLCREWRSMRSRARLVLRFCRLDGLESSSAQREAGTWVFEHNKSAKCGVKERCPSLGCKEEVPECISYTECSVAFPALKLVSWGDGTSLSTPRQWLWWVWLNCWTCRCQESLVPVFQACVSFTDGSWYVP